LARHPAGVTVIAANFAGAIDDDVATSPRGRHGAGRICRRERPDRFSTAFSLATATTLDFTLRDYYVPDNAGGISLLVSPVAAVPEPASVVLLALGLGLLWVRGSAASSRPDPGA
jgi:hypothetical protein